MDMSKWRRHLFAFVFIVCFAIYATTCVLQRKHGLSDGSSSPRWTNFIYRALLEARSSDDVPQCPTCHRYDLDDDLAYEYFYRYRCVRLEMVYNSTICLYDGQDLSSIRPETTINLMKKLLTEDEDLGVIDIGSKLGVYSLMGASMNRFVLAVEPNMANVRRFHKAVKLNHFEDRITLFVNAVSNEAGVAEMLFNSRDPGNTRLLKIETQPGHSYIDDSLYTKFITMNDLVQFCHFKRAIMRIDLDGFEHKAFAKAEMLFDNIDIPLIIMEWSSMRKRLKLKQKIDVDLIQKMVNFLLDRQYRPKTLKLSQLQRDHPETWPYDIVWKKA